jgi:hypothetical protein
MPIRPGSCSRYELKWRRASTSGAIQPCPVGGTNWRSSTQMSHCAGGFSDGVNCVPQAVQTKPVRLDIGVSPGSIDW